MNPAKFSQMMKYLTRAKKEKPDLPDVFPASKAPIPAKTQNVQETEAVNQFMLRNPRVEKAGGGRIGFMKGELVTQGPNTGKVKVRNLKLIKDKKGKIIKREIAYFKDMPAANAAIKKHKEGKFGQLKFKKSKKILNNPKLKKEFLKYAMGKDVTGKMIRKKYGLSNEEFFQGGLREILDKDFLQYSKSSAVKSNTIKNMLLLHNNKLSKNYIRNGLVVPDEIIEKLGLNEAEAATATARLSQHYSGRDFGFKELKSIRRNNKAGDKLFEAMNKFSFGNPYRSKLYNISLQLIDKQLGNETGTFESLKKKASYILKKNKIKGFDINEIAGVTGTAKTGVGEFSQFIDVMDKNLNQKQMAAFQAAFSKVRQSISQDPNNFVKYSKQINKLASRFEKEYGVKLPRIRSLDEVEKFYSPKRLKELENQGLDIKAASKKLGYTIQMPRGAATIQEFIDNEKIQVKIINQIAVLGGGNCGRAFKNQGGRIGLQEGTPNVDACFKNAVNRINQGLPNATPAEARNFTKVLKLGRNILKFGIIPEALFIGAESLFRVGLGDKPGEALLKASEYILPGNQTDVAEVMKVARTKGPENAAIVERALKYKSELGNIENLEAQKQSAEILSPTSEFDYLPDRTQDIKNIEQRILDQKQNLTKINEAQLKGSERIQDEAYDIAQATSPITKLKAFSKDIELPKDDPLSIDLQSPVGKIGTPLFRSFRADMEQANIPESTVRRYFKENPQDGNAEDFINYQKDLKNQTLNQAEQTYNPEELYGASG